MIKNNIIFTNFCDWTFEMSEAKEVLFGMIKVINILILHLDGM